MDDFPDEVNAVAARIQSLDDVPQLDQLTVNDYPPGVGLAPHVDTHSAFTGTPWFEAPTFRIHVCRAGLIPLAVCKARLYLSLRMPME